MEFEQFLVTTFTGSDLVHCGVFFAVMSILISFPCMMVVAFEQFCVWLRTRKKKSKKVDDNDGN